MKKHRGSKTVAKKDIFLELGLTEVDTHAAIAALTTTLECERANEPAQGSMSPFLEFSRRMYLKSLEDILAALKAAVAE